MLTLSCYGSSAERNDVVFGNYFCLHNGKHVSVTSHPTTVDYHWLPEKGLVESRRIELLCRCPSGPPRLA